MKAGDCILTPANNTDEVFYGTIKPNGYHYANGDDGCPYRHRVWVDWAKEPLKRSIFSVPLQNTMRSSLTVFSVSQRDEVLALVGRSELVRKEVPTQYDPYKVVLEQILELRDDEFEVLTAHLLTALGFEGTKVTGKTGDGGVDAMGELNVANLAKVKIFLQAKRYKLGTRIKASVVRELRQAIPRDGQGAFITTADYQAAAHEIALDPSFPRIGLINGHQLVDLLIEHWEDIPEEFRRQLGLRPGLVRV
jgi:restriction system protein